MTIDPRVAQALLDLSAALFEFQANMGMLNRSTPVKASGSDSIYDHMTKLLNGAPLCERSSASGASSSTDDTTKRSESSAPTGTIATATSAGGGSDAPATDGEPDDGQCADCGNYPHIPEGLTFERGDRCWLCEIKHLRATISAKDREIADLRSDMEHYRGWSNWKDGVWVISHPNGSPSAEWVAASLKALAAPSGGEEGEK